MKYEAILHADLDAVKRDQALARLMDRTQDGIRRTDRARSGMGVPESMGYRCYGWSGQVVTLPIPLFVDWFL